MSASNIKGEARARRIVPGMLVEAAFDEVYDLAIRRLATYPPVDLPARLAGADLTLYWNDGSPDQLG
ncbi:hypothetical protein JMJ55_27300 [Belnapia sp. T6]|uniref:Uncharacterized protein n=1 Tax=Belnapia mucosa TaxID=2804532 RepID=A0ABS1VBJ4_9PROT|nr:hypothetical protein [Belnapia mucosa]MBL6459040.1 hypothetical protein [Belnapia mucosa]